MSQNSKVPVKVQQRSGFDKSHKAIQSVNCGTITPILTDELMPNSKVNLKLNLAAQLPPLCTDSYARMCIKAEAFFVPHRLVYGGYQDYMTGVKTTTYEIDESEFIDDDIVLPYAKAIVQDFRNGGLLDYMDCRFQYGTGSTSTDINVFPILAYHKVWDDWYRNSLVQKPCFKNVETDVAAEQGEASYSKLMSLPWRTCAKHGNPSDVSNSYTFYNGMSLFDLHQRNFDNDYFTNATPNAQEGEAQRVSVSGNSFSIESLRLANSLQKFAERNNLAGTQYVDWLKAQYGANLSDGVSQRSILLGSAKFNVMNKGIYSTTNTENQIGNNPFSDSVGGKVGSAYAEGSDFIINGFEANEAGTLLVLITLMPEGTTYGTGTRSMWKRYISHDSSDRLDLANPMLQGTGNQPIYQYELTNATTGGTSAIFGYAERYADWKTMTDTVRGSLKEIGTNASGRTGLSQFVLQRSFLGSSNPEINSTFLEIPTNYMDGITFYDNAISKYGAIVDSYLDYSVAMPLAVYCQPTLESGDEEHQNTIMVSRNGSKI